MENRIVKLTEDNNGMLHCACGAEILCDKETGDMPEKCPKCGAKVIERKTKRGYTFYGCSNWPGCDFMTWDMPVATKCEKCGSTLFRKGSKLYCAKEGCGFEMPVPKKD